MRKLVISILIVAAILIAPFTIHHSPFTVHAAPPHDLGPEAAGVPQLQQLVVRMINISVGLAAIVLVVMLVFAGVQFIISGGEQEKLQVARKTATYAIVGFVLLAVAWLVIRLIETFTGVPVTKFCLGFQPYCAFQL